MASSDSELNSWNLWIYSCTFCRIPWTGDRPDASSLLTGDSTTQKDADTHTSKLRVGFEPTIPVFERSKTVRALGRAAIGTGGLDNVLHKCPSCRHLQTNHECVMQCSPTVGGSHLNSRWIVLSLQLLILPKPKKKKNYYITTILHSQ